MNSAIILAESYHSFRQGEGVADTLHNVVDFLKKNKKIWSLIPEVMSLAKIILVMPATNASSECTFSALRRVKSYLHTTIQPPQSGSAGRPRVEDVGAEEGRDESVVW